MGKILSTLLKNDSELDRKKLENSATVVTSRWKTKSDKTISFFQKKWKKVSSLFVKGHPSKGYKKLHIGAKAFLKSFFLNSYIFIISIKFFSYL